MALIHRITFVMALLYRK